MPEKRMECLRLPLEHLAWIEHQFLSGIRDSRKAGSLCGMMRGVGGVRKSIHHSWLAKELGLGLLCWDFKRVQEEIPSEEASTLEIGSVVCISIRTMHQSTTSSLSQTIWPRWASTQFLTLPCSLWLLVIPYAQRLSLGDDWGDERGCDEGHWHAHTRGLPWALPEVVGTVQQVHCSRRRLFQKGREFHVCTINKSAHMKKVWKLILCCTPAKKQKTTPK